MSRSSRGQGAFPSVGREALEEDSVVILGKQKRGTVSCHPKTPEATEEVLRLPDSDEVSELTNSVGAKVGGTPLFRHFLVSLPGLGVPVSSVDASRVS